MSETNKEMDEMMGNSETSRNSIYRFCLAIICTGVILIILIFLGFKETIFKNPHNSVKNKAWMSRFSRYNPHQRCVTEVWRGAKNAHIR